MSDRNRELRLADKPDKPGNFGWLMGLLLHSLRTDTKSPKQAAEIAQGIAGDAAEEFRANDEANQ